MYIVAIGISLLENTENNKRDVVGFYL